MQLAIDRARALWPEADIEAVAPLRLRLTQGERIIDITLERFYEGIAGGEIEPAAVDGFLKRTRAAQPAEHGPHALGRLRPLLTSEDEAADASLMRYPLADGLAIVLVDDEGESVSYLGPDELEMMRLAPDDALKRAVDNLAAEDASVPAGVQIDYEQGGLITIEPQDFYTAARLLVPSVQKALREAGDGALLVGAPARDVVVALRDAPGNQERLAKIVGELYDSRQSTLSRRVYRLDAAGLRAIDAPPPPPGPRFRRVVKGEEKIFDVPTGAELHLLAEKGGLQRSDEIQLPDGRWVRAEHIDALEARIKLAGRRAIGWLLARVATLALLWVAMPAAWPMWAKGILGVAAFALVRPVAEAALPALRRPA